MRLFSMKRILLLILASFFILSAKPIEQQDNDQAIIDELTEKYKKQYDAHEADPVINDIVQEALKKCGITKPIIVLQYDSGYISHAVCTPAKHPQEYIIVGTKQSLDAIIAAIYHEIGHVAHDDVSTNTIIKDTIYHYGSRGLSLLGGVVTRQSFQKYVKEMPVVSTVVGALAIITTFLTSAVFLPKYKHSIMEGDADIFAYENLIKHQRLDTAIGKISDHLYQHEFGLKSLPPCVSGYPTDFERANLGIIALQKHGISITHLIDNLPDTLDEGLKKYFPAQVRKFFQQILEEKK